MDTINRQIEGLLILFYWYYWVFVILGVLIAVGIGCSLAYLKKRRPHLGPPDEIVAQNLENRIADYKKGETGQK